MSRTAACASGWAATTRSVRKFEFRDTDGTLAKTLLLSDIRTEKNIPTAHRLEMRNEKTGSHTTVAVSEFDLRYWHRR